MQLPKPRLLVLHAPVALIRRFVVTFGSVGEVVLFNLPRLQGVLGYLPQCALFCAIQSFAARLR